MKGLCNWPVRFGGSNEGEAKEIQFQGAFFFFLSSFVERGELSASVLCDHEHTHTGRQNVDAEKQRMRPFKFLRYFYVIFFFLSIRFIIVLQKQQQMSLPNLHTFIVLFDDWDSFESGVSILHAHIFPPCPCQTGVCEPLFLPASQRKLLLPGNSFNWDATLWKLEWLGPTGTPISISRRTLSTPKLTNTHTTTLFCLDAQCDSNTKYPQLNTFTPLL